MAQLECDPTLVTEKEPKNEAAEESVVKSDKQEEASPQMKQEEASPQMKQEL